MLLKAEYDRDTWQKILKFFKFIGTEKILKRNILIVDDDRNISAAIFIAFFIRSKHWKLLKHGGMY